MNERDFRKAILNATSKYYHFLSSKKGEAGYSITTVSAFSRIASPSSDFICYINAFLKQLDTCEVFVRGIKTNYVSILRCGKDNHGTHVILRVAQNADLFAALKPSEITIRSDLRFLIKRLEKFYHDTPLNFTPPMPANLPDHRFPVKTIPSAEQQKAIDGVFSNPISYIWGPPGTGKTNAVLTECLLRYIRAEKRVFLLAPTNNAIEQMLRGILPILRNAKIDLHKVYRLGIATGGFTHDFPEVVGSTELELELALLKKEKSLLEVELDASKYYEQTVAKNRESLVLIKKLSDIIDAYYSYEDQLSSLHEERNNQQKLVSEVALAHSACQKDYSVADKEYYQCVFAIEETERQLKRARLLFWRTEQRQRLNATLSSLLSLRETLRAHVKNAHQAFTNAADAEVLQVNRLKTLDDQLASIRAKRDALLPPVLSSKQVPDCIKEVFQALNSTSHKDSLSHFTEHLEKISEQNAIYESVQPRSAADIRADIAHVENKLLVINKHDKLKQLEEALIVAGTVHSSLRLLSDHSAPKISHVFLDEAGYTSLAYGMIAFSCNCPVTFLGDHLQLPPICEMSRIDEENSEVALFTLPCAYLSELLSLSMSDVYQLYFDRTLRKPAQDIPPSLSRLSMYPLSHSYRFHDSLADILSEHVYPFRFYGEASADFEIIVVDAPNPFRKAQNNQSQSEAHAVSEYLISNDYSLTDDFIILAPYRNQVKLLKETIPLCEDQIFTVHRSQGMEFDTVIFSAVDKTEAFYSNSRKPFGRSVLNTAISRAKKRLVLVCDVSFWSEQNGQLISDLIQAGTPFYSLL